MDLGKFIIGAASVYTGIRAMSDAFARQERRRTIKIGDAELRRSRRGGPAPRALPVPRGMKSKIMRVRNINERVAHIVRMSQKGRADAQIRALAVKTVSQKCGKEFCIQERDYTGEIRAVFKYVRQNVRYVKDGIHADQFQHPVRTLQFGGGDCDDYTIVLAAMLGAIGYPTKLRVIQTVDAPDWNHIFMLVGMPPGNPRSWVPLDASVPQPAGWQPPRSSVKRVKDFEVP